MPEELAFVSYSVTSLTAPVFGVILGGACTHWAGGYTNPRSLKMLTWVSFIGTLISLPLPFINSYQVYLVIFWLCLFLGGFIMPGITGIMIHAAPRKYRAIANSIAFFSYNSLGYVPGPLIYGVISVKTPPDSRIGMCVLVYSLIAAFFLMLISCLGSSKKKTSPKQVEMDRIYKDSDKDEMPKEKEGSDKKIPPEKR